MTQKESLKLIKTLAALRDYPKGYPDAEAKLADVLMQVSAKDLKFARSVVERFEEQCPTPAQLREAAMAIRGIKPANSIQEYEKPVIECARCNDSGVIKETNGFVWCGCRQAEAMQREIPDWLNFINNKKAR
jgi:hypothetical protein